MANEEHKALAKYIKNVHSDLRKAASRENAEAAWKKHCNNTLVLTEYAQSMCKLATTYWEENSVDSKKSAYSRIDWSADVCKNYFFTDLLKKYRQRESDIAEKIHLKIEVVQNGTFTKVKMLDVGSCYNPFKCYQFLEVTAIDLCPANDDVLKCDFLDVLIGEEMYTKANKILSLKSEYFDAITFCFVLEYIPSSQQRIEACLRAYRLLRSEGLLIITTPDSKHVGANYKIMKCWRYTLALIGFSRIKYEKFPHMHCMAFRKSINIDIAKRWATIHRQPFMNYELKIPQDDQHFVEKVNEMFSDQIMSIANDFKELPLGID